ncbi:hypothetical protein SCALIN_C11_0021 [Candidatus Scalindua japonica]|uniref:EF-hand domain-containing protein n=1 Tax=Candidatus Scalindua japonica TaxID=1284222 RepID=A0A286TX15_9BACT|nr:hypothetical protein [Candidatus Scalindua japonica]GAX60410.1 hypothetical protein SCALIN_C11_0021 [Candidatus Scalindua japonica]
MKIKQLVVFFFALFSVSLAIAGDDTRKGPFFQMDSNKDEVVTKDEFMAFHLAEAEKRGKLFHQAKKQKALTEDNFMRIFMKQQEVRGKNVFDRVDKDSDGTLTKEEVKIAWNRIINDYAKEKGHK